MKKMLAIILIVVTLFTLVACGNLNVDEKQNNDSVESELKNIIKLNNGEMPDITIKENGKPSFIAGTYSDKKVINPNGAIESLNEVKFIMGIDNPKDEYKEKEMTASDTEKFYRLQQYYNGIPVYLSELIVVTDLNGRITSLVGEHNKIDISTEPEISEEEAESVVQNQNSDQTVNSHGLVIYEISQDNYKLAYSFSVGDKIIGSGFFYEKDVFVSAQNGEIIGSTNKANSETFEGKGKDLSGIEQTFPVEKENNLYYMKDIITGVSIHTANNSEDNITEIVSDDNTWPDADSVSLMNNLLHTVNVFKDNIPSAFYNDKLSVVYGITNYKTDLNNAYSDTSIDKRYSLLRFGDAVPRVNCLDAVAHEFTHSVISVTCGLNYSNESGAINESYADILGNLIENDDEEIWLYGEDHTKGGLRNLTNPNESKQPFEVDGKYMHEYCYEPGEHDEHNDCDNGGVHTNSGIVNHAAYLMWKNGLSKENLFDIFCKSLEYMTPDTDFLGCRAAVIYAARNLGLSQEKITIIANAFSKVGINPGSISIINSIFCTCIGCVVDSETKEGISDVKVVVKSANGDDRTYHTNTDTDGRFGIQLKDGIYDISFLVDGYENTELNDVEIKLWDKTMLDDVLLERKPETIVVGAIKDSYTNESISDVSVEVINNKHDEMEPFITVKTDQNGEFSLRVPQGNYSLSFVHKEYEQQTQSLSVYNNETILLDTVLLTPNIKKLTDAEAKKLWETANEVYCDWLDSYYYMKCVEDQDFVTLYDGVYGETVYYRIKHNDINSVKALNEYLKKYFSENVCNEILSYYKDYNGKLYYSELGNGTENTVYGNINIESQSQDSAVIIVEFTDSMSDAVFKEEHNLIFENGKWLFTDFVPCYVFDSDKYENDESENIIAENNAYDVTYIKDKVISAFEKIYADSDGEFVIFDDEITDAGNRYVVTVRIQRNIPNSGANQFFADVTVDKSTGEMYVFDEYVETLW